MFKWIDMQGAVGIDERGRLIDRNQVRFKPEVDEDGFFVFFMRSASDPEPVKRFVHVEVARAHMGLSQRFDKLKPSDVGFKDGHKSNCTVENLVIQAGASTGGQDEDLDMDQGGAATQGGPAPGDLDEDEDMDQGGAATQGSPALGDEVPAEEPAFVPEKAPANPDDLTKIKGLGPASAKRLNEKGVFTFAKLRTVPPGLLAEWLNVSEKKARLFIDY